MVRFIGRLVRLAAITAIAAATTLSTAGLAQAQERQPNCSITHDLHPYSDNMGGAWQLELEARCAEFQQSGTSGITWRFWFWAETYDGDRLIQYFNEDTVLGEERSRDGQHHYVGVGAPLGFPRYCYSAEVTFDGLPTAPVRGAEPLGYVLGRHCRNV